jgi:lipoyl(octanoyl) transferase
MLPWQWLGRLDYRTGIERQQTLRDRLLDGDRDAARLLLLEHEPVITLGRHGQGAHVLAATELLAARGIEVVRTSRGGDVTYHGPGQLMVYPAVRLHGEVAAFLASLAGALSQVATALGVPGARWRREPAGLWLAAGAGQGGEDKLAACGIHLRRGAVMHGFAFNVSTPADAWQLIVPCGLAGKAVTSVAQERAARGLPPPPAVEAVARMAGPLLCEAMAPHLASRGSRRSSVNRG